jgi:1,4-alpha-glucan branching enzyme
VFQVHIIILSLFPELLFMKRLLLCCLAGLLHLCAPAQLLTWSPPFPVENDPSQNLVISVDATKGNGGLLNYTPTNGVYVHIGVITNLSTGPSDWKYVPFTWGTTPANGNAAYAGNNKWQYSITGSLRNFFGITNASETIQKIVILFRSATGTNAQRNTDGSDMYIPVYSSALAVRIDQPASQPKFLREPEPQNWTVGSTFNITANANKPSAIKIYFNNNLLNSATGVQTLSASATILSSGSQVIIAEANDGTTIKYDTLSYIVGSSPVAALPAGVRDGINYEPGDTSVTLVLRAPGKTKAMVIGEFNNWSQNINYLMNRTPDGRFFWIRIKGLQPGTEYGYQYIVDDNIKIADPYTEKVLDPSNDGFISAATYPGLKSYPSGQTGIVSLLQTATPAYNWTVPSFSRPDKRGLVIYELLVRDFVAAHDWKTIQDSLTYLKNLGINAIEIMPFNEFEGNTSWGYNPNYYFAPDKYYGPANTLKRFVDSCHKKGIAVIMDIALNHSFGSSPMVQLYWDAANSRPAANNPWFNPIAKHAYNVGYDMNHQSNDTKYYVSRIVEHWLQQYKIDGFRFDLSKGFTQNNTCTTTACTSGSEVSNWSNYDASRVAIWKQYYDTLQVKSQGSYAILEHFAANQEEKELADYGMLLWSNQNYQYNQAVMGFSSEWDFSYGIHSSPSRNFTKPHLVTYMESHDEERLMYKTQQFGNGNGSYNTRVLDTALLRSEMAAAFLFTFPGPKMIWQFGELGYDYSINTCSDGVTIDANNCRLASKPIRWDYLTQPKRKKLYTTYSNLLRLRANPIFKEAFLSGIITQDVSGAVKWIKVSSGDTAHLLVVGNFDINQQSASITFQTPGTWFDYLENTTLSATGSAQSITLRPGEYHVYVSRNLNNITVTAVNDLPWSGTTLEAKAFPMPAHGAYTLELAVPQGAITSVRMFNAAGQQVLVPYNGFLQKGTHRLTIKTQELPSGIYYMEVQSKNVRKTISVTLQ